FEAGMGAEALKKLLEQLDLVKLSTELREKLEESKKGKPSRQKLRALFKRLELVEALRDSGPQNKPEWTVLECIPVLPPALRPLTTLKRTGEVAVGDLNELYQNIIEKNNRLKQLIERRAPEAILRTEKRELQRLVDGLLDNTHRKKRVRSKSG